MEFHLSDTLKCPLVKIIDLGFVMHIDAPEVAVFVLLTQTFVPTALRGIMILHWKDTEAHKGDRAPF